MVSEDSKRDSLPSIHVHYDFRPIKIKIYRNGDPHDPGTPLTVTRREFKHWVIFLDAVTKKLKTTTPVHRLHTVHGSRIDHFDELEPSGEYVAVERGPFIDCKYGEVIKKNEAKYDVIKIKPSELKPIFLESAESMDIYLKKEGYGSYTGLPYPFDGVLMRSPSSSALHMKSHSGKLGGSMERLSRIGTHVWEDDQIKSPVRLQLPRLVGIGSDAADTTHENSAEDLRSGQKFEDELKLPPIEKEAPKLMLEEEKENDKAQESSIDIPVQGVVASPNDSNIPSPFPQEKIIYEEERIIATTILKKDTELQSKPMTEAVEQKIGARPSPKPTKDMKDKPISKIPINVKSSLGKPVSKDPKLSPKPKLVEHAVQVNSKSLDEKKGALVKSSTSPEKKPKKTVQLAENVLQSDISKTYCQPSDYEDMDLGYIEGSPLPLSKIRLSQRRVPEIIRGFDPDFDY